MPRPRAYSPNGFHATSLEAVAEDARFSRGAVYYNFSDKEELFLELLDRRCGERALDLREVFADTNADVEAHKRQTQLAAPPAFDAMTGDKEWRALYMEFLAHAARDADFRRRLRGAPTEMRGALDEVVVERARCSPARSGWRPKSSRSSSTPSPPASGPTTCSTAPRAVPPNLFPDALALLGDGVASRAAHPRDDRRYTLVTTRPTSSARLAREYPEAAGAPTAAAPPTIAAACSPA